MTAARSGTRYQHTARTSTEWWEHAACRDASDELQAAFFPKRHDSPDAARAAEHCRTCPVAADCLNDALTRVRTCGVWAGRYFNDGQHRDIPPPAATRVTMRELAEQRRAAAYDRYWDLLDEGLRPPTAYKIIAAELGVQTDTARTWITKATTEARATA